ncbi:hypothetical protein AGMMS50239_06030 [Bacteroidia bacterium]|nr:hypothetical protein AGMMS50239_06030 [Bacteroidia bacterium]
MRKGLREKQLILQKKIQVNNNKIDKKLAKLKIQNFRGLRGNNNEIDFLLFNG